MHVDCSECAVRGSGCADCVISVLLGEPEHGEPTLELGQDERRALAALADSGLVPPLRLVRGVTPTRQTEHQPWLDTRFAE
ncbi:MAG: hypothetical protein Q4F67_12990 [Propionibacteriaceae bacterium]|nr:hypothetical protein [Propionibacteriaceae bacterium]